MCTRLHGLTEGRDGLDRRGRGFGCRCGRKGVSPEYRYPVGWWVSGTADRAGQGSPGVLLRHFLYSLTCPSRQVGDKGCSQAEAHRTGHL